MGQREDRGWEDKIFATSCLTLRGYFAWRWGGYCALSEGLPPHGDVHCGNQGARREHCSRMLPACVPLLRGRIFGLDDVDDDVGDGGDACNDCHFEGGGDIVDDVGAGSASRRRD